MATGNVAPEDLAVAAQQMLAFFCDHLVILGGSFIVLDEANPEFGQEKFFAYPGFILSVQGVWHLVTAGHCLEDLENALCAGKIRLTNCCLADYFRTAPRVREPIPFDYQGTDRLFIHNPQAGLDFTLVTLRPFYRMSLEANGIRSFTGENWVCPELLPCDFFALLGLPSCLVNDHRALVQHGDRVGGVVNPTMVFVDPVVLPPEEIPPATFPWFIGRVRSGNALPSIEGMSGGPIFGFAKNADGQLLYWIVAVQSRWRETSRITFGCPVGVFVSLVEQELERREAEGFPT